MDEKDMNDLNILGGFLKLGTDRVTVCGIWLVHARRIRAFGCEP